MSRTYTTMSREAINYLCSVINQVVSLPTDVIDNLNLATNTTYSSIKIKTIVDKTLEDAKEYANEVCAALVKLECRKTTTQPTLENSDINVIYLYSADGNAPFQQYLKISETELVYMGSTNINLDGYLTATEITRDYVTKLDFDSLKTEVERKVNKTDIIDNLTSTDTNKPLSANQGKILDEKKVNKTDIATTIDSSSTDDKVPTTKSVWDSLYKICDPQVLVDANNPTSKICMADLTTLNTPSKEGVTSAESSLIISIEGRDYWNGQISICMAEPEVYVRSVREVDTWTKWQRVCTTSVVDTSGTATISDGASGVVSYKVINGVCYVAVQGLADSLNGKQVCNVTGLPKPSLYVNEPIEYLGERVGTIYCDYGTITFMVHKISTSAGYGSFSYPVEES